MSAGNLGDALGTALVYLLVGGFMYVIGGWASGDVLAIASIGSITYPYWLKFLITLFIIGAVWQLAWLIVKRSRTGPYLPAVFLAYLAAAATYTPQLV